MKVNFMIIGAQKCGTSTLFNILKSNPRLVGSNPKEPHFFSKTEDWRNNLHQYEALFEPVDGAKYFEASTSYTFYPLENLNIWDDIYEYNRDMKFIYVVRNPIDRIVSAYMHVYERGYESRSLEEALCRGDFLIPTTRYHFQISPFISRFGRDQVLIIDFDDLINDRRGVVEQTASFVGVPPTSFKEGYESTHANASLEETRTHHKFDNPSWPLKVIEKVSPSLWHRIVNYDDRSFEAKPTLSRKYREVVARSLESDIRSLEKMMDKDLSSWLESEAFERSYS